MGEHEAGYKRQIDLWVKVVVLLSLPLNWGITWGLTQGQLSGIKESVSEIKGWIKAHDAYTMASIKETGEMLQQLKSLNENMGDIRRIVDERMKK